MGQRVLCHCDRPYTSVKDPIPLLRDGRAFGSGTAHPLAGRDEALDGAAALDVHVRPQHLMRVGRRGSHHLARSTRDHELLRVTASSTSGYRAWVYESHSWITMIPADPVPRVSADCPE